MTKMIQRFHSADEPSPNSTLVSVETTIGDGERVTLEAPLDWAGRPVPKEIAKLLKSFTRDVLLPALPKGAKVEVHIKI
jgi:hypothetical protein